MSGVAHHQVAREDAGMRLDRWLRARFPGVGFAHAQKLIRSGQIRVDGGRARGETRLAAGQSVRVPPLDESAARTRPVPTLSHQDEKLIRDLVIYQDDEVIALNKPPGLATQGGTGVTMHVDRLLGALADADGERPRLVHRLDQDTSGVLLIARTRTAAASLARTLKSKKARKVYWAIVRGVPSDEAGRISTYLVADERTRGEAQRIARHGEPDASYALTNFRVIDRAGGRVSWVRLEPATGRKHQLRVHMAHIGHPIVGDRRYFNVQNWEAPGGLEDRLHLHARRIVVPHPTGGTLDITAPPPKHFAAALSLLGFEAGEPAANRHMGEEE